MDLRVLRYFLAVAKEGSISGAAESLYVTQPTLSRQLMDLEEELGAKLLVRGGRKLTLTEKGMFFRKRAQEIVDLADRTRREFRAPDEIVSGDIHIGGGEMNGMRLIANVAVKFQNRYPHVRYHFFSGSADDVMERLDKGLLDFGVLIEPGRVDRYERIKLPATEIWGVLMRKDSPLAARETITSEDLRDAPLLVSRRPPVQNEISRWMGRNIESLDIKATYNLIYNAAIMVEKGMGYALCLYRLVNVTGDCCLCFRPLRPRLESSLDVVWKKYQVFSKAAEKFLMSLQEELSSPSAS
ncbi:MAG: LysR family transcriptional regulator [Planctomycetota bacterium]|nr:LysR family transcriptional regulator [Planctomycetota bacterium]